MKQDSRMKTFRLLWRLIETQDRLRFGVCLILIVIGTFLEMLSLALVVPVVGVVLGDKRQSYTWIPEAVENMRFQSFTLLLLGLLISAFTLKNAFLLVSNYFQSKSQMMLGTRTVQKLFETYLKQPYEFHLTNSSSILMRNLDEYSGAVQYFFGPALNLLSDALTGISLLTILLFVDPTSTLLIGGIFGMTAWIVLRFTRRRARIWGEERMRFRASNNDALLSGFGGIKEILLFGRHEEVLKTHRVSTSGATRTIYLFQVIQSLPRAFFEVLAVAGVCTTIIVAKASGQTAQESTTVIALFGVVAFRMLPSINRIVSSLQQISFVRVGIEGAVSGLSLAKPLEDATTNQQLERFESLEVSKLIYKYPNSDKVVTDVDHLIVHSGESIGVVGSSGCGKSTLIDLLIGVLNPISGGVKINGIPVSECRRNWQNQIGYVPQHVYLMDTTIRKNVAFGLPEEVIDNGRIESALRQANLMEFVHALPHGWDTEVGERGVRLSGGQRQRLGIARALYGNPEVIVLDEATSALDSETEREIVESFREIASDHTLIVVAHRTSTLAYCSRLIRLENGRIVQDGTYEEVVGSLSASLPRGQ